MASKVDPDDAGQFRIRQERRKKISLSQSGNGHFEEVSEKVGISKSPLALASAAADLRGTGHPDLFVANDYGVPNCI